MKQRRTVLRTKPLVCVLVIALGVGAIPMAMTMLLALGFVYDHGHVTRAATCAVMTAFVIAARRALAHECAARGLQLEIAAPAA